MSDVRMCFRQGKKMIFFKRNSEEQTTASRAGVEGKENPSIGADAAAAAAAGGEQGRGCDREEGLIEASGEAVEEGRIILCMESRIRKGV